MVRSNFIKQRMRNIFGDSELDDGLTKNILAMIEEELDLILKETEPRMIFYRQGSVAALQKVLEKARLHNKQQLVQEELDEE